MLILLAGCKGQGQVVITATPGLPTRPPATATPRPALSPDHIWVGAEAEGRSVASVSPEGRVDVAFLPLNDGQSGTHLTASPDGRSLAYLVWDEGSPEPVGIAMWTLVEPNARLIVQPLPGYRIISLLFSDDSQSLLFVQAELGLPADAGWRLESVPVGGGQSALLADRASAEDLLLPEPIAWSGEGPVMLMGVKPGADGTAGIYRLDATTGHIELITPPEHRVTSRGALSPDRTQLAYAAGTDTAGISAAKVLSLSDGAVTTLAAPEGGTVISVAWLSDSQHVILDMLAAADDRASQTFALAEVSGEPPWPELPADPNRAELFTYFPFGSGVAYTLYPPEDTAPWVLTLYPVIAGNAAPQTTALERIGAGAPRILRTP